MEAIGIEIIEALGLIGIAAVLFAAMIVVFIPSEIFVAYVGYVAANGGLPIVSVIIASITGVSLGMSALYGVARFVSTQRIKQLVAKYGHFINVQPKDIDKAEIWFRKYDTKVAFLGQLVPAVRFGVGVVAGIQRISFWRYFIYTTLGATVWVIAFALLGYHLSEGYEAAIEVYEAGLKIAGLFVILIVMFLLWRRRVS